MMVIVAAISFAIVYGLMTPGVLKPTPVDEMVHPGDLEHWKSWQEGQNRLMLREIEKLQRQVATRAPITDLE